MNTVIKTFAISISLVFFSCNATAKNDLNKVNRDLQQATRDSKVAAKEKTITEWKNFTAKSEEAVAKLKEELQQFEKKNSNRRSKEKCKIKRRAEPESRKT